VCKIRSVGHPSRDSDRGTWGDKSLGQRILNSSPIFPWRDLPFTKQERKYTIVDDTQVGLQKDGTRVGRPAWFERLHFKLFVVCDVARWARCSDAD